MTVSIITSVFGRLNTKSLKNCIRIENVLSLKKRSRYLRSTYIRGIPGGRGAPTYLHYTNKNIDKEKDRPKPIQSSTELFPV